jgi:hypothetical protein
MMIGGAGGARVCAAVLTKDPRKLTALGIPTTRANPIPASSFFAPVCSTPSTEPIAPQDGHEPRHCCTNTCSTSTPDHRYAPAGVCGLARLLARRWRDAVKAWDGVI